jgi:hypothetical protein
LQRLAADAVEYGLGEQLRTGRKRLVDVAGQVEPGVFGQAVADGAGLRVDAPADRLIDAAQIIEQGFIARDEVAA